MTKFYERIVTRNYKKEILRAWAEAEEKLGMKNSLFVTENGITTQYMDSDEGDAFHEKVKSLTEEEFDKICVHFFKAIEEKDKVGMFIALAYFDEMDNYDLGNSNMKRRLMRVRKPTHEIIYKI